MDVRCLSPLKSHCKSNNAFSEKKEAPKSKTIEYLLTQNKIVVLLYTKRKVLKFFPSGQKENLGRRRLFYFLSATLLKKIFFFFLTTGTLIQALLIFNRHHVSETVLKLTNSVHKVNSISKILIKEFLLVKFHLGIFY